MNLKTMSDATLIKDTEKLVRQERELLGQVLHHLKEIDRRRLYSSLGYPSLFDFAVRKLEYPEDQAYRRISAMKLLREIPEIEAKINSGEISLTHIGLAQKLFKQEKKISQKEMPKEQKLALFTKIARTSVREAEKITLALSPLPVKSKPDRISSINADHIELKFQASQNLGEKIDRLKGLLAHRHPNLSLGELFEKLCDLGLQEWEPSKIAAPRKRRVNSQAQVLREVRQKAQNCCEQCGSNYALEIDHIFPRALGGSSDKENLRLLCRSCNQRSAIQFFGADKMEKYLRST